MPLTTNKLGPAILGGLPEPSHVSSEDIRVALDRDAAVVLDTRPSRTLSSMVAALLYVFGS